MSGYFVHFALAIFAGLGVSYCTVSQRLVPPNSVVAVAPFQYARNNELITYDNYFPLKPMKLSTDDIKHRLSGISSNYEFYYAGMREPERANKSVVINIQKTTANVVLVLSSHKAVHWRISNPHKTNVLAFVYGSKTGKSGISGDLASAEILLSDAPIGSFYQLKTCACVSASFQCIGDDFEAQMQAVEALGDGDLTGVSHRSSASSMSVPALATRTLLQREVNQQMSDEKRKSQCFGKVSVRPGIQ